MGEANLLVDEPITININHFQMLLYQGTNTDGPLGKQTVSMGTRQRIMGSAILLPFDILANTNRKRSSRLGYTNHFASKILSSLKPKLYQLVVEK